MDDTRSLMGRKDGKEGRIIGGRMGEWGIWSLIIAKDVIRGLRALLI